MIFDTFGFVQLINACAGFGALEAGIHIHDDFKVVASLVSLWGIAWLTCIQNVGALSLLGECSRCSTLLQLICDHSTCFDRKFLCNF